MQCGGLGSVGTELLVEAFCKVGRVLWVSSGRRGVHTQLLSLYPLYYSRWGGRRTRIVYFYLFHRFAPQDG